MSDYNQRIFVQGRVHDKQRGNRLKQVNWNADEGSVRIRVDDEAEPSFWIELIVAKQELERMLEALQ